MIVSEIILNSFNSDSVFISISIENDFSGLSFSWQVQPNITHLGEKGSTVVFKQLTVSSKQTVISPPLPHGIALTHFSSPCN